MLSVQHVQAGGNLFLLLQYISSVGHFVGNTAEVVYRDKLCPYGPNCM